MTARARLLLLLPAPIIASALSGCLVVGAADAVGTVAVTTVKVGAKVTGAAVGVAADGVGAVGRAATGGGRRNGDG